jgi:hypothetical protein
MDSPEDCHDLSMPGDERGMFQKVADSYRFIPHEADAIGPIAL